MEHAHSLARDFGPSCPWTARPAVCSSSPPRTPWASLTHKRVAGDGNCFLHALTCAAGTTASERARVGCDSLEDLAAVLRQRIADYYELRDREQWDAADSADSQMARCPRNREGERAHRLFPSLFHTTTYLEQHETLSLSFGAMLASEEQQWRPSVLLQADYVLPGAQLLTECLVQSMHEIMR